MSRPICADWRRPSTLRQQSAALATAFAVAWPHAVVAQQQPAPSTPAPVPAQQQFQQSAEWSKLPRMQLERQFAGPLQDTVIQRLRDPVDGTVCYLYLPISVAHSLTAASGFVQYGPNAIGTINCVPNVPVPARRK
jgi:hypothetical protein